MAGRAQNMQVVKKAGHAISVNDLEAEVLASKVKPQIRLPPGGSRRHLSNET